MQRYGDWAALERDVPGSSFTLDTFPFFQSPPPLGVMEGGAWDLVNGPLFPPTAAGFPSPHSCHLFSVKQKGCYLEVV